MNAKQTIEEKITKLGEAHGSNDGVVLIEDAYHRCNPNYPEQWQARAVKIVDNELMFGCIIWEHEDELEDASSYDWSFSEKDFEIDQEFDLTDTDDLEYILDEIL